MDKYIDQKNWPAGLEASRLFALQAIKEMKYRNNVPRLMRAVEEAPTVTRVQKVIINAILAGEGMRVVR